MQDNHTEPQRGKTLNTATICWTNPPLLFSVIPKPCFSLHFFRLKPQIFLTPLISFLQCIFCLFLSCSYGRLLPLDSGFPSHLSASHLHNLISLFPSLSNSSPYLGWCLHVCVFCLHLPSNCFAYLLSTDSFLEC